ncbi:hypothetical protein [Stenotrophomonas acidaminiphila]
MIDPDTSPDARRSPVQQLGAVLWPSFFVAAVAAALFFAFFDPLDLQRIGFPRHGISRGLGYTAGFFLAWLGTFSACGVTALLLRPPAGEEPPLE